MAGLVGYASSDEEDEIEQPTQIQVSLSHQIPALICVFTNILAPEET